MQIKFLSISLLILPLVFDSIISDLPHQQGSARALRFNLNNNAHANRQCSDVYYDAGFRATNQNWRDDADKKRWEYIELAKKCAANLRHGMEKQQMKSVIDYDIEMFDSMTTKRKWKIVAIVFIVAFILAMIGLAAMAFLLYNRKR